MVVPVMRLCIIDLLNLGWAHLSGIGVPSIHAPPRIRDAPPSHSTKRLGLLSPELWSALMPRSNVLTVIVRRSQGFRCPSCRPGRSLCNAQNEVAEAPNVSFK